MNLVDLAILLVLAITILGGLYRGFLDTVLSTAATLLSWGIGMLAIPFFSGIIKGSQKLFNMMLYYTEGSEYVAVTDVELTRAPISGISAAQLDTVIQNADMPIPMGERVTENIATEAFSASGITSLGDYFNQTIVCVVINILVFAAAFLIIRLILGCVIRAVDFSREGFPVLSRADGPIGAGLGLIHGVLLVFVLFTLVPIALVVLPKLYTYLADSFFGAFFYQANFMIRLIPGT